MNSICLHFTYGCSANMPADAGSVPLSLLLLHLPQRSRLRCVFHTCLTLLSVKLRRLWFTAVVRHKLWQPLAAAEGRALSPLDMCLIPWWVMIIFWLKFLVIWRFFRWVS
jgi:hypothetical protein